VRLGMDAQHVRRCRVPRPTIQSVEFISGRVGIEGFALESRRG
jgi:hypothetical protein